MKRLVAMLLTFTVTLSLLGITAFAEVEKATRVKIVKPRNTLAVGRTMYLDFSAYPSEVEWDDVSWSTNDYDLIDLDDFGEVTGLEPGTATVKVELYMKETDPASNNNGKNIRVGSATAEIKITGTSPSRGTAILPRDVDKDGNVIRTSNTNGAITSTTVSDAVKKALVKGSTASATFKNYDSVSAYAIQSAATAMKGGTVTLNFDTMDDNNAIEGRLTINPANASNLRNDINTGVYTSNVQTYKGAGTIQKYFKNDVLVVKAAHSGSYGMSVKIAVKSTDKLSKSKDLRLYTYNPATNKYSEVKDAGLRIDENGFVHFNTTVGDYLVISNGALVKK